MWNLPGPRTELVSPAWAGRFLTTGPPEKPQILFFQVFLLKNVFIIFGWAGSPVAARGLSLVADSRGYCPAVVRGFLIVVSSLIAEHRF